MANILVIDDDPALNKLIQETLRSMGHTVQKAYTLQEGLNLVRAMSFAVIFLDIYLPDGNGLDLAPELISLSYKPEVVIVTGQSDSSGAELSLDLGAFDYLQKPFGLDEIRLICSRAIEFRESRLQRPEPRHVECEGMVGRGELMNACLQSLAKASAGTHNILITGETGTGKELVAKAVHANSSRSEKNFIIVDCAALKDTLLESTLFGHEKGAFTGAESSREGLVALADGGTLFLDEIGELNMEAQKSFLRLLEEKRFYPLGAKDEKYSDFRLVAATNRDLVEMTLAGEFRTDLYYRICGQEINVPRLRDRPGDVRDLVFYYVERICGRMQIPVKRVYPELIEALAACKWPGNVRELVNVLDESISSFPDDPALHIRHLPKRIRLSLAGGAQGPDSHPAIPDQEKETGFLPEALIDWRTFRRQAIDSAEKKYFRALFSKTGGSVRHMAEMSGLTQARVYDIIKKHGLTGSPS